MKSVRKNLSQWVFALCALILSVMGILYNWLIREEALFSALWQTLAPLAAACALFQLQCRFHFLESLFHAVRTRKSLTVGLIILAAWLLICSIGENVDVNGLLILCYVLFVCICDGVHLEQSTHLLLTLSSFLLFFSLAAYVDDMGTIVTLGVLGVLTFWHTTYLYDDKEGSLFDYLKLLLAYFAAFLCSHCLVCWHHIIWTIRNGSWISESVSFNYLLLLDENFGNAFIYRHDWYDSILKLYFLPGYLSVGWSVWAALALVAVLVIFLLAGQRLCSSRHRVPSMLTVSCVCLLSVRILNVLMLGAGWDMGVYGLPFFGGFWKNLQDFLLAALALAPMVPVKDLLRLDPGDEDYAAQECLSLRDLPRNEDGLAKLSRHVFNFGNRPAAWKLLFTDFMPLLEKDINTLRIMVLNAQENYDPTMRVKYPLFFQYAEDPLHTQVPEQMVTCCPDNAFLDAAETYHADEWYLHRYEGEKHTLLIPPFYVGIDRRAFRDNRTLEAVSIPATVRYIEDEAFRDCTGLRRVELRPGLEVIGAEAFAGTALTELTIPDTVTEIASGAFRDCEHLQLLTIPDSLKTIAADAFEGCVGIRQIRCSESWRQAHMELWENISLWADIPRQMP